jgi:fructose-1-phosphate kinase PfkB-like protein
MAGALVSAVSSSEPVTVVLGLNAALQKRFLLDESTSSLIPGNVHRARSVQVGVGGKGQDVAVTLQCLRYSDFRLLQFVGTGPEGDAVARMLENMFVDDPSVLDFTVRPKSGMRTCTSIVAQSETTELVEPSGIVAPEELQRLLDVASTIRADALCVMGSLPPGCPEDTYAQLYRRMADANTLILIDSVVGLVPLLDAIADARSPAVLKCNASELCRLGGVVATGGSKSEAGGSQKQDELVNAVRGFLGRYPASRRALNAIAITDGAHPAHVAALPISLDETEWRLFQLPIVRIKEHKSLGKNKKKRPSITSSWGQHSWIDLQSVIASTATKAAATVAASGEADRDDNDDEGHDVTAAPHVYPIGAGDAVAAGMLAAWKILTDARNNPRRLPPLRLRGPSEGPAEAQVPPTQQQQRMHPVLHAALAGNESPTTRALLAAFSFGLACGTASCLNEQNSVVELEDVLQFYSKEGRPIFLSSYHV